WTRPQSANRKGPLNLIEILDKILRGTSGSSNYLLPIVCIGKIGPAKINRKRLRGIERCVDAPPPGYLGGVGKNSRRKGPGKEAGPALNPLRDPRLSSP